MSDEIVSASLVTIRSSEVSCEIMRQYLNFVFPYIIIYGFIKTSLMQIV